MPIDSVLWQQEFKMISEKTLWLIISTYKFGDSVMGIPFYWDKTKGGPQMHGVNQRSLRLTLALITTTTRLLFIIFIWCSVFLRADTRTKDIVQAAVSTVAQFSCILIQMTIFFKAELIVQHVNAFLFINSHAGKHNYE